MRGYMFRNRTGALLFVVLTLLGVAKLVGTGEGDGALEQARRQIAADRADAQAFAIGGGMGVQPKPPVAFTPDDELIDPATGDDPTPIDQLSEEMEDAPQEESEEAPHDTVVILRDEAAGPAVAQ